ncbi:PspA/IM30 family protein [Paenibacillus sp. GSMTC-2017]|uniref:PspA/IM30 family protein n=1 Tax=Paenibacillus sp. GSMTC-2017 TaxID=2794350 RepID=UPI0018D833D4|nr:PspA/IM30 family protein [Paenibacillus sp. GSMTC-2017]MBH5319981.1 PspA/IM30 family protein [Paenibacillus sp. GSMTC-2017]
MSLFKRLRDLTLSNVYSLIEKAEDPIKLTDQYIRDMTEDLQDAEKAVAAQIALEKKFKKQFEEQEQLLQKRNEQAQIAVQEQNIDLARRVIEDKQAVERKMNEYKEAFVTNQLLANNLRAKLDEMRTELTDLKNKRDTLVARYQAAKTQTEINKAMSSFGTSSAASGMKRMEEKMLQAEALAEASNDLAASRGKSIDDEFANLGKNNAVEDELAALMKQFEQK